MAAGDARLAGGTAADVAAFGVDVGASRAAYRAIDPAAWAQVFVGRVDDGIDREFGDIAPHRFDARARRVIRQGNALYWIKPNIWRPNPGFSVRAMRP